MSKILTIFTPEDEALLRREARPVDENYLRDRRFSALVKDLRKTMHRAHGIGFAATQIGQDLQVAVIDRSADAALEEDLILINPTITKTSPEHIDQEEGCLSVPGVYGIVTRPSQITFTTLTPDGTSRTITADGLLARVVQHETDHLHGRVFIDLTSRITKGRELLT